MRERHQSSLLTQYTANQDSRGATTGTCTEGRISTRTRARTRAAARMNERLTEGRGGRQRANRQQCGASPPQQVVAQITPSAPQLRQVSSQTSPLQGRVFHYNRGRGTRDHRRQRGWGRLRRLPSQRGGHEHLQGSLHRWRWRLCRQKFSRRHRRPSLGCRLGLAHRQARSREQKLDRSLQDRRHRHLRRYWYLHPSRSEIPRAHHSHP